MSARQEASSKALIHKTVVITLITLCFTMVVSLIVLDLYFFQTRPRTAEPKSERIYPADVKGTDGMFARVYITRVEKWPFEYFPFATSVCAVMAYLLNQRWRCFSPFKRE
jgi:hypothetical protein